ncbi:MAG: DUF1015 domain-containing protein [bacterium]|nr:DUF1015 domain-containing protein [bacterium]
MVEIKPFRGYRYNIEKVKDISRVIAPPWDIIDNQMEEHLLKSSPFNIINLISKNYNPDNVKKIFDRWREESILKEDIDECLYFMKHRFKWDGKEYTRKGIFTLLHLEDFTTGNVIPHEKIFEKHSINRYQLIKICRTNFSPVFMLYQDRDSAIEHIIDRSTIISKGYISDREEFEFGIIKNEINHIKNIITPGKLIIADGHHRYNAALKYYKENPSEENSFVLVFLVNINSPDVLILPTHRYFSSGISFNNRFDVFQRYFHIKEVSDLKTMTDSMALRKDNTFGIYESGRFYIITLKDINEVKKYLSGKLSDRYIKLDTVILHQFILPHIFESQPDEVIYHQLPEYLLEEYKKRENGVIFFLNAVKKQHFLDICFNGELMPQKTTYFYPKVPSGLVIYKFPHKNL